MFEVFYKEIVQTIPLPFFKAGFTILSAWIFAIAIEYLLDKYVKPKTYSPALVDFMGRTLRNVVLIIALLSAMSTLGINVQGLIAGFGLTGFAVGFALKDTLSNIIAGIFILLYRPFRLGQYIKVATSKSLSDEGFVKKVDLRYTTLENENEIVLVPNSVLFINSIAIFKNPPTQK